MSEEHKSAIGVPIASWVKGGSTSAKHDKWMAEKQHDAKKRREEEDQRFQTAAKKNSGAKIHQQKLGGRKNHPVAVLGLKHPKDGTVLDWMLCEIVETDPNNLILMMYCPRCIRTYGRPVDDSIIHIAQANRMWHLDKRSKKERQFNPILGFCAAEVWIAPDESREVVMVGGMVSTDDWCKCPICDWKFKIEDSVVHTWTETKK